MYITALDREFKVIKSVKVPNRIKAAELMQLIEGAYAFVWTVNKQKKGEKITLAK